MTIVATDLTTAFPEFGNTTLYPVATINFWINEAYAMLSPQIFGTSLDLAAMLYTAHNIVLSARNVKASASGGIAGDPIGPVSSKAVGSVSKSYDIGAVALANAGIWNSTSYGQRLYQLYRANAAGGIYVPGPSAYGPIGQSVYGLLPRFGYTPF